MILYWIVISNSGAQKLCRWFAPFTHEEKEWVLLQVKQQLLLPQVAAEAKTAVAAAADRSNPASGASGNTSRVLTIPPLRCSNKAKLPASSSNSGSRAVYRQHASVYCVVGINGEEVPLVTGEVIDLWLRVLFQLLGTNPATEGGGLETQLSLHLERALLLLDTMLQQGYLVCTDSEQLLQRVRDLLKQD